MLILVLRQDKKIGLEVVDLAKDPLAAGPLAGSITQKSKLDKAPGCPITFESLTMIIFVLKCNTVAPMCGSADDGRPVPEWPYTCHLSPADSCAAPEIRVPL